MEPMIQVENLCKSFSTKNGTVEAARNISFSIEKGETVAIVGASGSGKSTMLHVMGGVDTPNSGNVIIDGKDITRLNDEEMSVFRRRKIGFVFQNYNLLPILTVYENIVLPIEIGGKDVDTAYVEEIMTALGLDTLKDRIPSKLSGGQQQRVAIARALATKPAIILADEPTGNLNSEAADEVMELLKKCVRDFDRTVIMITHNEALIGDCSRILHIRDGVLTEEKHNEK